MNTHSTLWKGLALAVIALPLLAACGQALLLLASPSLAKKNTPFQ